MHSSLNRLNHLSSLATTYVLVLLGLISLASYYTLPPVELGRVDINDFIM
jgi:signal peptidase complex subunit 3